MNSHAHETPLQYAFRKCNEAIAQTRHERTLLHGLLSQAEADKAAAWIAAINHKLHDHRIKLNQLTARRSNLRKKLNASPEQVTTG